MVRNVTGFAVFAFLAAMAFKLFFSVFGWLLGLVMTVLVWAVIGFAIYTALKIFMPGAAAKVKSTINGNT